MPASLPYSHVAPERVVEGKVTTRCKVGRDLGNAASRGRWKSGFGAIESTPFPSVRMPVMRGGRTPQVSLPMPQAKKQARKKSTHTAALPYIATWTAGCGIGPVTPRDAPVRLRELHLSVPRRR